MATTPLPDSTQHTRNSAAQGARAVEHLERIGGLSRIVDRDIEILKTSLVQCHYRRDDTWASAWARLENAWETVRSELVDDGASTRLTEDVSPTNGVAGAAPEVDAPKAVALTVPLVRKPLHWFTAALAPAISSSTMQIVRWSRDPARRAELRAAALKAWSFAGSAASAGAKHVSDGWLWLEARARKQVKTLQCAWARVEEKRKTARSELAERKSSAGPPEVDSLAGHATGVIPPGDAPAASSPTAGSIDRAPRDLPTFAHKFELAAATHLGSGWVWRGANGQEQAKMLHLAQRNSDRARADEWEANARARLERAKETVKSKLADGKTSIPLTQVAAGARTHVEEPTGPFILKPLPWVLAALSPVISSRTLQIHHGCHHSQCIELANRLSRDRKELAGKSPLEIVRWAREHARGTELLAAASDAWNHGFFFQCLTPAKKRPGGELRRALERSFGDFASFADKFALAGATHVGSGWLWLVANRRKQVRILTTSDTDCPEARGHTCLLAIDLWEHAYYFDHQSRRREYLDAVIDRRLDWQFAEQRYRLVTELDPSAPRETASRAVGRKRGRHHKRRRKSAASRTR